jgi:3-dehydroquinate synthase
LTGYTSYLHGEAVAIGMVMAADLSWRQGLLTHREAIQIKQMIGAFELPLAPPVSEPDAMLNAMGMDKKVLDGRLRLILTRSVGDAFVTDVVDQSLLRATLSAGERLCDD